jgi:hypothetical protein
MSLTPATVSSLSPVIVSAIRDHRRLQYNASVIANTDDVGGNDEYDVNECVYEEITDIFAEIAGVEDIDVWYQSAQWCAMEDVFNDMVKTAEVQIKADRLRRVLEQHATAFAVRCGFKVGTREYVLAARKALDEARTAHDEQFNGERRMDRAATSRACGVSGEDHYANEDYLSSEFHKDVEWMQDVLNWLEENCPLLMHKIAEEPAPAE